MTNFISAIKALPSELNFARDQFNKIIWPTPLEAAKIFTWTATMLTTFGLLITFVIDPISILIVKTLAEF